MKKSVFCYQIKSENDLIPIKSKSGTKYIIKCNEKCDLKQEKVDFKQEQYKTLNNTKNINIFKYLGISVIILIVSVVLMIKFFWLKKKYSFKNIKLKKLFFIIF